MKKFSDRFDINIESEEAKKRFVNRVKNLVFDGILYQLHESTYQDIIKIVATGMGKKYEYGYSFDKYIDSDFLNTLQALEIIHDCIGGQIYKKQIDKTIKELIIMSEVDLDITWSNGNFYPSGVKEFDEELVNMPLKWLRLKGYENVLQPFEKGLKHYLQSLKNPEFLADVITDMYESLEGLAKQITGRNKDLSANKELFIKEIQTTDSYKEILKQYIKYANKFRHAVTINKKRTELNRLEVESFIYLTVTGVRLDY